LGGRWAHFGCLMLVSFLFFFSPLRLVIFPELMFFYCLFWKQVTSRIEHPNPTLQRLMPPCNTLHFPIPDSINTCNSYDSIIDVLRSVLLSIEDAAVEEHKAVHEDRAQAQASTTRSYSSSIHRQAPGWFLFCASCDSWSRSARRKRGRGDDAGSAKKLTDGDTPESMSCFYASASLVCTVCIDIGRWGRGEDKAKRLQLGFQWVYGWDRALFESFVSHVRRKVVVDGNSTKRD